MNKKRYRLLPMLVLFFLVALSTRVRAANDTYTVNISGKACYATAYKMMNSINTLRKQQGASALTYDAKLSEIAMQRAAECAIYYDHTRPNGQEWKSIYDYGYGGENIHIMVDTPEQAFNGWKNSSGHYANMINTQYKSIGLGCFYNNGYYTWVQVFSSRNSTGSNVKADQNVTKEVEISSSVAGDYYLANPGGGSMLHVGSTTRFAAYITNKGESRLAASLDVNSFSWTSKDPIAISVDQNGLAKELDFGTAYISTMPKKGSGPEKTYYIRIRFDLGECKIASIPAVAYTGEEHKPLPVVTYKGKVLEKDQNYKVEYNNNREAGIAYVTIIGKGRMIFSSFSMGLISIHFGNIFYFFTDQT